MKSFAVKGEPRTQTGKKANKAIRNNDSIPCVLYGKSDSINFQTTEADLRHLVYSPDFQGVELTVDNQTTRAILKDIQFHPVSDQIRHVDFLKLYDGVPVKVEIPLKTKGQSPGVKVGGKLIQSVRRIKVKTLPEKLVDELFIDISGMELGQSLRIKDIESVEGIEIMQNPSIPVVSIEIPRALRSAASAATTDNKK